MSPAARVLEATFGLIEDAVVVEEAGERGTIVYVNAAFERASGYAPRDAIGRASAELLRARPVAGEPDVFVQVRASGEEYIVHRKRAPLAEAVGQAGLVVEIQRDVTGERALRDSEALYRKLAERASDLISRADGTARVIYMSPSVREVLGYEPDELVGRRAMTELAHPDDQAEQTRVLSRFVEKGLTSPGSPLRRRIRRKDGTYVWLEVFVNIERDAGGHVIEVQSWARDVTARVTAEHALARAEDNFRSLLDHLPDAVAVHRDGTVVYANVAMLAVTGYTRSEELVGRSVLEFALPDERPEIESRIRERNRPGMVLGERRLVTRDGSTRLLDMTVLPILFEGEIAYLMICRDVSERKRMEEQLAATERLALLGRLASGVGHEINNPLMYLLGSLDLADADVAALVVQAGSSEHSVRLFRNIATVRDGAERVRDIVRDLKSLSASPDARLGPVDVERTLDVAAATVDHEIRLRARLVRDYGRVPMALASEGRLAQVFVNLLVNAAQAIPDGDANGNEIRITTRVEDGRIVIEVQDTGVGIAEEDLPRIFEPFFTTKPKGIGTGLGLSISHTLVAAQGGALTAERLPARGALFRVTLQPSTGALAHPSPTHSTTDDAARLRLLLVDDEPQTTRVLADLLAPHDVVLAHSGREALARLASDTAFDAIVCDLQMNHGTGVDVYEHLRAQLPHLARRTVFTTGGAYTERAQEFLRRCPQPVLAKPFAPERLVALLRELASIGANG